MALRYLQLKKFIPLWINSRAVYVKRFCDKAFNKQLTVVQLPQYILQWALVLTDSQYVEQFVYLYSAKRLIFLCIWTSPLPVTTAMLYNNGKLSCGNCVITEMCWLVWLYTLGNAFLQSSPTLYRLQETSGGKNIFKAHTVLLFCDHVPISDSPTPIYYLLVKLNICFWFHQQWPWTWASRSSQSVFFLVTETKMPT